MDTLARSNPSILILSLAGLGHIRISFAISNSGTLTVERSTVVVMLDEISGFSAREAVSVNSPDSVTVST